VRIGKLGVSLIALAIAAPAAAQDSDVLIMRRAIAPAQTAANDLKPVEGADLNGYYWVVSGWLAGADQCSATSEQTRYSGCVYQGKQADPENCPTPAPETSRQVEDWRGCTHQWTITSVGKWADQCSETFRPVTAECRRPDGTPVPDIYCSGEAKPQKEEGFNDAGCTYDWAIGEYGDWKSTCSENTSRERQVVCIRSDGSDVSDNYCGEDVPDRSEPGSNLTGCEFTWVPSAWSAQGQACGEEVTETRTVSCQRTDGEPAESDAFCTDDLPALERQEMNYDTCSHEWVPGEWTDWDSTCSTAASRERDSRCVREDGEFVDPKNCDPSSRPIGEEEKEILSGCTHDWVSGEWSSPNACSANAVRTRSISCRRSDGTLADESLCQGSRPIDQEPIADYSGCEYEWEVTNRTGWSSTCSAAATATQTSVCKRSNGDEVDASYCEGQARPPASIVSANYTGCETEWAYGEWSDWDSACSPDAMRERDAECYQIRPEPQGLTSVEDQTCNISERETVREEMAIYSQCPASWEYGDWGWNGVVGAKSSSCSTKPLQTRTAVCRKIGVSGERETVSNGECVGSPETTLELKADLSGCNYEWINDSENDWTPWSGTCSPSATRTRPVACQRDDGEIVNDEMCDGPKPESLQTGNVTDCTGLMSNGGFEADLTGWQITSRPDNISITTDSKVGDKALIIGASTTSSSLEYSLPNALPKGSTVTIEFWCKGWHSSSTVKVGMRGNSGQVATRPCPSTQWMQQSVTMTINENKNRVFLGGAIVFVDDIIVTN